jgi:predicted enzyme related to lactoylglutathione lyase
MKRASEGGTSMLKRIKFTTVPVANQSRALEFYTRKLGFKVFTDQTKGEMRWIELQIPGAETLLVLFQQADHQPGPVPAVALVADNVHSTYEELRDKGVEFTQPPKKEHWGEHAIMKDSEGNLLLFSTG